MSDTPATILIVDDEIQNRKLLETLLRPEGYLTCSVASGEEALACVERQAPDLILLDIMMPGMDGYAVAGLLKANRATSNIPIIMITANDDRIARLAGLNAGAEDFLTKPVDRIELWLRVRNLLRLKVLGDFFQNHSLILEQQVEARTQSLHASESRFRQMAENIHDVFFLIDAGTGRVEYISPAYEEIWGLSCAGVYANPESWVEAIHPDDRTSACEKFKQGMMTGTFELEYRIVRPDGTIRWIGARAFPVHDDAGKYVRITGVAKDITGNKTAADRIAYLNRVYAVLSGINVLIVRVHDRDELFKEACQIAITAGGFRMAFIGVVDADTGTMLSVASAGMNDELLASVRETLATDENAQTTMIAQALREKKPIVSNDSQSDPRLSLGRKHADSGVRSLVILPLLVADAAIGFLVLYAGEIDFFHDEELKLLAELAGDIAFTMDHIAKAEKLDYLAYYDVLTGLANRTLFLDRVAQYLRSARTGGHQLAVCLFDLERFKNINDSLGQATGDALLRQVAQWLTDDTGDVNLLARIGADHFAIVLPEVMEIAHVARFLEKTLESFVDHPFVLDNAEFRIAAKIGVALFPDDGADAETLFRNAEAALKKAKASGDRYLFFTQRMTASVAGKLTLENQLRQALHHGEFVLHYQPKVSFESGQLVGVEALIRWNDPRTGLVPPGRFIPVLEEIGLIHEVGRWALRQAIDDHLRWRTAGLAAVRIAVNVSPLQLRHREFIGEIEQTLDGDPLAAAGLELELTESMIMEDVRRSIATLRAIRALGVTIAVDDFGTGFSSLSYLSKLPVDTLKVDRSFIVDMTAAPEGLAMVSTIINLAHALKLKVVAEGVETDEQASLLRLLGCDEMQGFLFSKALPRDILEERYLAPAPVPAR